ncbi:hypothetical protein DPMN_085378 [Dreissena polymorpha]|uniref:Uncharacterized protein n=1 Tax=Dreissena polymorpha TaxID=45954 RepID=A0A9D4BLU7_DREPO|nr:hypothetical protein DPMN_085378 [Dreissena polymorpha]
MKIGHQIFKLSRSINGTNVLTKFHEDQTINVPYRVFTMQNGDDARRTRSNQKILNIEILQNFYTLDNLMMVVVVMIMMMTMTMKITMMIMMMMMVAEEEEEKDDDDDDDHDDDDNDDDDDY